MRVFGHDFQELDEESLRELQSLERERAVYADLWIDEIGDFRHVKIALSDAEAHEYARSMWAWELFLRAGAPARAADVPGIPPDIAARADSYQLETCDGGSRLQHCPAGFIGPELEELFCSPLSTRRIVLEEMGSEALFTTVKKAVDSLTPAIRRFNCREKGLTPWPVKREDDVRDLLYAMLRASIGDLKLEEPVPSRGGSYKLVDLASNAARLFIEVKWIGKPDRWKAVIEEIAVDCQAYGTHPSCRTLAFVIVDACKAIPDPSLVERELSGQQTISGTTVDVHVFVREP